MDERVNKEDNQTNATSRIGRVTRRKVRRSSAAGSRERQAANLAPKHVTAFLVGLWDCFLFSYLDFSNISKR